MLWSGIERFSMQGVSFIFTIFLARMLSPSDYGVIAMLSIFLAVCQTFVDSGFANALIRKVNCTERDYSTAFYFNVVVGVSCYAILFFVAPIIASFYKMPILTSVTRVVSLSLIFNSLCIVQQAVLVADLNFKIQAKVSLVAVILSGFVGIGLAYKGFGVWALAFQSTSNSCFRMIFLWLLAHWRPKEKFSKDSFRYLFSYGSKLLASGLLDTIYNNVYPLVIGKFYTSAQLGAFSRAQHFAQFPSSNVTGILKRVSFPVLSSLQDDPERLRNGYVKFLKLSAFIIFPLMMMMAALSRPFVFFLLTEKWSAAVPLLWVSCLGLMWYPVHAINLNLLQVKGRSDLFLRLEIVKKIIGVIILVATVPFGVMAMCIGLVVASFVCLFINTYYTGDLIQLDFFKQMKFLIPIFVNSLIMGGAVFVASHWLPGGDLLKLIVGGVVGSLYYIGSNALLKTDEYAETRSIIFKKRDSGKGNEK